MISRKFYFNITLSISLIVIVSALAGYLLSTGPSFIISILCLIAAIILTISLISYLNSTNRRISFFFDAVRNDDSNVT